MKRKLIIIILVSTIISVIIYFYSKSDELSLMALGDSVALGMTPYDLEGVSYNDYLANDLKRVHKLKSYIKEFSKSDITVKDLIYDIKENKELIIKNKPIKIEQAIYEADILTLSIGTDEILNKKITKNTYKEFNTNIEELFYLLKHLNTHKVIIISLYNNSLKDPLTIEKFNAILRDNALKSNFIFLDISNVPNTNDFFNTKDYFLNYEGHKRIYNEIKKLIF